MAKVEFDPYSHQVHDNPYPWYKALRDNDPVYFNEKYGFWILSRFEDVQAALRDFKTFSNCEGVALEAQVTDGSLPMILNMDPPKHTKTRKVISTLLTPERIARIEPYIRQKTLELLEPFRKTGKIDILADFSVYLPMAVIARMIKVPESEEDFVRLKTDTLIHREEGQFEVPKAAIDAYFDLAIYFDGLVKQHWDDAPDDSLISAVIEAEKRGELTHDEVLAFMMVLGVAGNETTTKMIGNLMYRLWQNKAERQKLLDNPSLIPLAIEEIMRFDGSSQLIGRTVMQDITLHGKTLKKGQRVGLLLISANRDERKYPNPEVFDATRGVRDHMGFGFGVHACVGAALARLEGRVAFEEILRMMPDFEIDESGLERMHSPNVRGFTRVPVSFTPTV